MEVTKANKVGRPTKYKPEYAELAYNYCLLGATDKDLANFFMVEEKTINNWKETQEGFLQSIARGKEIADAEVAKSLYQRAKGYEHPETITATFQGKITDEKTVTKHYPPDTPAAIMWLKNRQPKLWREKTDIDMTTTVVHEVNPDQLEARITELLSKAIPDGSIALKEGDYEVT